MFFSVDAVTFQMTDRSNNSLHFVRPCQVNSPTCSSYYIHPVYYNVLGSPANKEINSEPLCWNDILIQGNNCSGRGQGNNTIRLASKNKNYIQYSRKWDRNSDLFAINCYLNYKPGDSGLKQTESLGCKNKNTNSQEYAVNSPFVRKMENEVQNGEINLKTDVVSVSKFFILGKK